MKLSKRVRNKKNSVEMQKNHFRMVGRKTRPKRTKKRFFDRYENWDDEGSVLEVMF